MTIPIMVGVFLLSLFIGIPIFFVLALTTFFYFFLKGLPPLMIMQRMFVGLDQFVIMAVPMFILAGNLMSRGGTTKRLVEFAKDLVGHLRGGLAHMNVVASMFFAGITGAATADVASLGPLEIEMMEKGGYKKDFATAVTISSACIGPIIPPSLPLVVYGVVASVSIGGLFLAGFIPGILMGLSLMVYIVFATAKFGIPSTKRPPIKVFIVSMLKAIGPLCLPLIILLGIYTGKFTPTEAAAVACVYAFILGFFIYKEIKLKDIPGILLASGVTTAASLSILGMANVLSWILAVEQVPAKFAEMILSLTENKYLILLLLNIGMLILGLFMETLASIMICSPIFLPVVVSMGVHPLTLGVVMAMNLTLGLLTPPLGLSLFIASSITGLRTESIVKATVPFVLVLFVVVLLVSYFPPLTLFLPRLIMPDFF